jgi:hypothetical protein
MSLIHRAFVALLSTALAVTLVVATGSAQAASRKSPAGHGATWLAGQLHHGLIVNHAFSPAFKDYGLTADTALGLAAIGGHRHAVHRIRHALAVHVGNYTTGVDFGAPTDRYAGAVAKLLVVAQDTGARARHFGGVDLVGRLAALVSTSSPTKGRIEDISGFRDNANTIGQIFAVRGLLKAGSVSGGPALRFLLKQQCDHGYFRLDFNPHKRAAKQGCAASSPADTDVTALAVIELTSLRGSNPALAHALRDAVAWLRHHQRAAGGFGGGPTTSATNANSTGLAGWAFITAGQCGPEHDAAVWVRAHQVRGVVSGTPLAGEGGAIAYDHAAMKAARRHGITRAKRDQWRRATAQAAPALQALHGCIAA